jgi:O-antigen/teichoic acid export membrane protein
MSLMEKFRFTVKKLVSHEGVRKYASNTSWLFVEQVLRLVSNFLIGIYVVRYLGPEQFGILSYALAFSGIFAAFSKLGLDEVMVRQLFVKPERKLAYLGTGFWMKVASGISSFIVIAAILPFTDNDATTNFYILLIAATITAESFIVIESWFHSIVKAKFISLCKITQLVLSGFLKIYFMLTGAELFYFVLVHALDILTLAIFLYYAYKKQDNKSFFGNFKWHYAKALIRDSWPLMLITAMAMIYFKIDQIFLKLMLGEAEVGIYASASRILEAAFLIPTVITASLFPAIINARLIGEHVYYQRLQYLFSFLLWMAISASLVLTIISEPLMVFLFGEDFREAGLLLAIKIWAFVVLSYGMGWSKWMYAEGRFKINVVFQAYIIIVNIGLNLWLIPIYGTVGAAIASVVAISTSYPVFAIFIPSQHLSIKMFFKSLNIFVYAPEIIQWIKAKNK